MKANIWWMDILARKVLVVTLILTAITPAWMASLDLREGDILQSLFENYDGRIRPTPNNITAPTIVNVNLMIRNINELSDVKMEYTLQVILRMQWQDLRLKYDNMGGRIHYLTLTGSDQVWIPDLFFKNEKSGHFHNILRPNIYTRIFPNGNVLYSIRLTLTLSCPMNLQLFPLDRQRCQILIASYGWTTEDLVFLWKSAEPVQVTKNLHLPKFTLVKFITDYCNSRTNTGTYSCLKADLVFKREFAFYLLQYYVPSCMLVIISWISFWIDEKAILARVFVGLITLLTASTQISSINQTFPEVSYTKAIDVWMGICLTFMFIALLELILVHTVSDRKAIEERKARKRQWGLERDAALEADTMTERNADDGRPAVALKSLVPHHTKGSSSFEKVRPTEVQTRRSMSQKWLDKYETRGQRIDFVSRIFFPVFFLLFNIIYWVTYLYVNVANAEYLF